MLELELKPVAIIVELDGAEKIVWPLIRTGVALQLHDHERDHLVLWPDICMYVCIFFLFLFESIWSNAWHYNICSNSLTAGDGYAGNRRAQQSKNVQPLKITRCYGHSAFEAAEQPQPYRLQLQQKENGIQKRMFAN